MTKAPTDLGASVRARLLNEAKRRGEDFQLVLTRYLNERLLYRLSRSSHAERFILKGAALFTLWTGKPHRPTRDVDLLGFGPPDLDDLRRTFQEIVAAEVPEDGVAFDPSSIEVAPIREDQDDGGVRIKLVGQLKEARVRLQVDVGFGDAVTPAALTVEFPTLLAFPAPTLRAYPVETVVAEKVEAMVKLGLANSRMKDFYDVVALSKLFAFDDEVLGAAIEATFRRRLTPLPRGLPPTLTSAFASDPAARTRWAAFVRKSALTDAGALGEALHAVAAFVEQPLAVASARATTMMTWPPGGPWVAKGPT
jgi:predicted nucleotidyltransferase component of viral defense system